jgi:hypothetical protein
LLILWRPRRLCYWKLESQIPHWNGFSAPQHLEETAQLIERFVATTNAPFVVAANKQDLPHVRSPEYIQQQLNLPSSAPVLPCVANDPRSVRAVLLTLLNQIEATTHSLPEHIPAEPRAFTVGVGDVMPVYL